MSPELHEMHALLQQFQEIHQSHDLDHCEGRFTEAAKKVIANARDKAAAAAHSTSAVVKGAMDAHKQHNEDVKTEKDRNISVKSKWLTMKDPERKQVLKNVVEQTDSDVLETMFLGNPTTKNVLQECILPSSPAEK